MEALVTIKARPGQFDVLREALDTAMQVWMQESKDATLTAATRREATARAKEAADLLGVLRA